MGWVAANPDAEAPRQESKFPPAT